MDEGFDVSVEAAQEITSTYPVELLYPETRGLQIQLPPRIKEAELRHLVERAVNLGFNFLAVRAISRGYSFFPSATYRQHRLPAQNPDFKGWNPLAVLIEECRQQPMQLFLWFRPFVLGPTAGRGFAPFARRYPGWLLRPHPKHRRINPFRTAERLAFCPGHPGFRRFMGDLMYEVVESYPIDGLVIDYTNFPLLEGVPEEELGCFCGNCEKSLADELRLELKTLPLDPKNTAYQKWQEWKRLKGSEAFLYWRARVQAARRAFPVVAEVKASDLLPNGEGPRSLLKWKDWVEEGLAEEIVVADLPEMSESLVATLRDVQKSLSVGGLLLPMFRCTSRDQVRSHQSALRRAASPGFMIYAGEEIEEALNVLGEELFFGERAFPMETSPRNAILRLIEIRLRSDGGVLTPDGRRMLEGLRESLKNRSKIPLQLLVSFEENLMRQPIPTDDTPQQDHSLEREWVLFQRLILQLLRRLPIAE